MGDIRMSENTTEVAEPAIEVDQSEQKAELPADHPLVKTLALQKAEIRDLKGKAGRLAEIEEAQKSESEKAADRIAKAETEASTVPAKVAAALRDHLVTLHAFDAEDAELFLTADEPELLLKQVSRLLGQSDKRQRKNHVPSEGQNPTAANSDEAAFARRLLSG
jgi:hypothetical protein